MIRLSASRSYPVAVDAAFDTLLPIPLEQLFRRGFALIPPIRGTGSDGAAWERVGQRRVVDLAGPGSMHEELVDVRRPHSFTYRLDGISGPMAMLVESVLGEWVVEPAGTGTRITWSWDVEPRRWAGVAMPLFGWMWEGYAQRALAELEQHLVQGATA